MSPNRPASPVPAIFLPMEPEDYAAIEARPCRRIGFAHGSSREELLEHGADLAAGGAAWSAWEPAGRVLCCAGMRESFAGHQGIAWAVLAAKISPAAVLAIVRFARRAIAASPLRRIEALVDAGDAQAVRFAEALGLERNAELRRWGECDATVILFERIL